MAKSASLQHSCTQCGTTWAAARALSRLRRVRDDGRGGCPGAWRRSRSTCAPAAAPRRGRSRRGGSLPDSARGARPGAWWCPRARLARARGRRAGVGKSTLLFFALGATARDRRALLVTGEESVVQVKLAPRGSAAARPSRSLRRPSSTPCARPLSASARAWIHSVQTLYSSEIGSAPGSGLAGCARRRRGSWRVAKEAGLATFLVGHLVTKDGSVAGLGACSSTSSTASSSSRATVTTHTAYSARRRTASARRSTSWRCSRSPAGGLVGVAEPSATPGKTVPGRSAPR